MRKIIRSNEPDFWRNYKNKYPIHHYNDLEKSETGKELRRKLRQHLLQEQYYLCAYCCRSINLDDSLNEHIKPKNAGKFRQYSMDYNNIVACCNFIESSPMCSQNKKDKYDENLFVSPLDSDCETHFVFYPNGEIKGITDKGKYTCDLLQLNSYKLRRARRAQILNCESLHSYDLVKEIYLTPNENGKLEQFADIVDYFFKKGYFDIDSPDT